VLRRLPLLLALLACALAAGCGGDDSESSSAITWADGVCSALSGWTASVQTAVQSLSGGDAGSSVENAVADVKTATSTLADDLKDLGSPDLEAGDQAEDSLDGLANDLEESVDTIESAADGASGVSETLSAVSTISATLATMGNQVSSTLDELEQLDAEGELTAAFENAESCSSLAGEQS
jgi:uncharacterized protein YukE